MPARTLRARTLPYRPELLAHERICTRCGIKFNTRSDRKIQHTKCIDCRPSM
jgi:hypothetical protein